MDRLHHAEEPFSPDPLDGNSVRSADADFSAGRKRYSRSLLTQPRQSSTGRNSPVGLARGTRLVERASMSSSGFTDAVVRGRQATGNADPTLKPRKEVNSRIAFRSSLTRSVPWTSIDKACRRSHYPASARPNTLPRRLGSTAEGLLASSGARRRLDFPDSAGHGDRFFASIRSDDTELSLTRRLCERLLASGSAEP